MKKTIICSLLLLTLLAGCTSKEENDKIKAFWGQFAAEIMTKSWAKNALPQGKPMAQPPADTEEENTPAAEPNVPEAQPVQPSTTTVTAPAEKPIKALLFLSPTCPWCKRLKSEGWPQNFRRKYQGQVELVEYDLSVARNEELLMKMMRQRNMTRIGYPALFVGNSVIQGYPLSGADAAVQKALAARTAKTAATSTKTAAKASSNAQKPYMQIVMEEPVKQTVNTKASVKDRQAMQAAFAEVQANNKKTLSDIEMMFGSATQVQALSIINNNERTLKSKMGTSATYKAYLEAQNRLLKTQEQQLNELMQRNAHNIRSI